MKQRHIWQGLGIYTAIVIVSVLVLFAIAAYQTRQQPDSNGFTNGYTAFLGALPTERTPNIELIPVYAPTIGPVDAPITIVEFADFQCPFCRASVYPVRQLLSLYPDKIRFVFRQFPIASVHPLAQTLAEASLCAHDQNKFWAMHDQLYAQQDGMSQDMMYDIARSVGLDINQFDRCLANGTFRSQVQQDFTAAAQLGSRGTPTWIVNGQKLEGALPLETWKQLIDSLLKN